MSIVDVPPIPPWQKLGSARLAAAATPLTVSFGARDFLHVMFAIQSANNVHLWMRFNGDSSLNYRWSQARAPAGTFVSGAGAAECILAEAVNPGGRFTGSLFITNINPDGSFNRFARYTGTVSQEDNGTNPEDSAAPWWAHVSGMYNGAVGEGATGRVTRIDFLLSTGANMQQDSYVIVHGRNT